MLNVDSGNKIESIQSKIQVNSNSGNGFVTIKSCYLPKKIISDISSFYNLINRENDRIFCDECDIQTVSLINCLTKSLDISKNDDLSFFCNGQTKDKLDL